MKWIEKIRTRTTFLQKKPVKLLLCALLFILAIIFAWKMIGSSVGVDWRTIFRPATLSLLQGKDPYDTSEFMLAPWVFFVFIPISLLPENLSMAVMVVLGLCAYTYIAVRLKAKSLGVIAILLSPMVLYNLIDGNIDWLAMLGFILPPQIGLFFLALKPQIGLGLIIYWAYITLREKRFIKTFAPIIIVTLISFAVFGFWPARMATVPPANNASLWPESIPFGLILLIMALRKKKERIAQALSPLLSPHVMFHSWVTFLMALAPDTLEVVTASASAWLLVAISKFV